MSHLKLIFIPLLLLLITACEKEPEITEIDDPELVAVEFFDALYNQKDVKKAASVCSPQLARIILHYKSPQAVARHLFNMKYDQVTIKPDKSGIKIREQFRDKTDVIVYFDGVYNEKIIKDVKKVSMIQNDDGWVIDKILKDPF